VKTVSAPGQASVADGPYWLFQANPERADGFDIWNAFREGATDWWLTTRYASEMEAGQRGVIWVSGVGGGVLGRFVLESMPTFIQLDGRSASEKRVHVRYEQRFDPHLNRVNVREALPDLPVFAMPHATNYRLTGDMWSALETLADGRAASEVSEAERAVTRLAGGQGFVDEAALRRAIELRAMALATEDLETEGWTTIKDVSAKESFDILCRRGAEELRVEVKGTRSVGEKVLITEPEVVHARKHAAHMALCVVSGIVARWTEEGEWSASGGSTRWLRPWDIDRHGLLKSLGWSYTLT